MQQEKMGYLLKTLRKEKGLTQEQMAEQFGVTNRTISRWENGINMPDISILVEIANYFEIGILELIEGERKQEAMITEKNEELKKIANYADEQKSIVLKNVHRTDVMGLVGCLMSGVALEAYMKVDANVYLLLQLVFLGLAGGMLGWNIIYASGIIDMFRRTAKKYRFIRWLELLLLIALVLSLCRDSYLLLLRSY